MVAREFVEHLVLRAKHDFAKLRDRREQGGADLLGFYLMPGPIEFSPHRSDTPKRLRVVNEANRSGDREEDENEDESEGVDDILDEKVY